MIFFFTPTATEHRFSPQRRRKAQVKGKKKGSSLLIFKMPTTLSSPVGPWCLQPRSMLLHSINDSLPLIRGNKSVISAVAALTGPPGGRTGPTKPAMKCRLLTHIAPRRSIYSAAALPDGRRAKNKYTRDRMKYQYLFSRTFRTSAEYQCERRRSRRSKTAVVT